MLEKLSVETAESGREHPFVEALTRGLEARQAELTDFLINTAASAHGPNAGYFTSHYGARVFEVREILKIIREAGSKASG